MNRIAQKVYLYIYIYITTPVIYLISYKRCYGVAVWEKQMVRGQVYSTPILLHVKQLSASSSSSQLRKTTDAQNDVKLNSESNRRTQSDISPPQK